MAEKLKNDILPLVLDERKNENVSFYEVLKLMKSTQGSKRIFDFVDLWLNSRAFKEVIAKNIEKNLVFPTQKFSIPDGFFERVIIDEESVYKMNLGEIVQNKYAPKFNPSHYFGSETLKAYLWIVRSRFLSSMKYFYDPDNNYKDYLNRSLRYHNRAKYIGKILTEKFNFDKRNCKILEYACATGMVVEGLQKEGFENTFGYDICTEAVKYGVVHGVKNLTYDLDGLTDQNWDVLLALDVFEHLTLSEIKLLIQNLKPKKLILKVPVSMITGGDFIHPNNEKDSTHIIRFTKKNWVDFIKYLGYTEVYKFNYKNDRYDPFYADLPNSAGGKLSQRSILSKDNFEEKPFHLVRMYELAN